MPLALSGHCPVCHSKDKLLRCQGCKAVPYCGRQHQESHRKEHKSVCNAVKKARTKLENEERKLRAMPGDMVSECAKFERISDSLQLTPPGATIFEDNAGHFWGIHETRHYMRSRYGLVEALLKIKGQWHPVEEAHDHIRDLLRLCRGDNMGVRSILPPLKLRLGKDQECYDVIKFYATTAQRGNYDWGDMSQPFLNSTVDFTLIT